MDRRRFSRIALVILLLLISALFFLMVRRFLLTLFLAAILAGLASPLYRRLLRLCRGRRALASALSLLVLLLVILLPLGLLLGIVAGQAYEISQSALPWIQARIAEPDLILESLRGLPGADRLAPYRDTILAKAGELAGTLGGFLVASLQATTRGTVSFFFQLGILLYALYFFLMDGGPLLERILGYLPLAGADKQRLVAKFTSVSRATLKGTLLIGLAQGCLAGLAFAVVGIEGAVFWGAVMTLLSVIPGVGTALIWLPAGLLLIATGRLGAGIGLLAFCALIVGSIDNLLRPRLVGRDTEMHELLILLGTLGGLALFGAAGFIAGPILAALFATIWELYGVAFADLLVEPAGAEGPAPEVPLPTAAASEEHKP